jgi:aminotransferase
VPRHADYLDDVTQAMSIKFNNRMYELQERGEDIIVLSLGEAFFDIPLYRFDDLQYPALYHYSHSRGIPGLRQKLADYYQRDYGVPVDPDREMIITAGSKIAIHMALMAILNPGDEVIIHEPAWVSYTEQVKLCHANPVTAPYHVPITSLERYVTSQTKALIINHPHNPSGKTLSRIELQAIHDLARQKDIFIVSDEAYSDFLLDGDVFVSCAADDPRKEHSIVCNSMSKNYGMSGWRIGYVISNAQLIDQILKINQHLVTCPASILEFYLERHFEDVLAITKPQIRDVVRRRDEVIGYLDRIGIEYLPGSATFYVFASIEPSSLGSEEFCSRLLAESKVCVVPGVGYGKSCDRFVRISVGTESMQRTFAGIDAIRRLIDATARLPELVDA